MAKATVGAGGIEYIQGALKKPKKQDGHNHGNYVIMTHRTAATTNPDCQRIYVKDPDSYKRNSPLSQREIQIRNRFTAVSQMIKARKADLSKITTDQESTALGKIMEVVGTFNASIRTFNVTENERQGTFEISMKLLVPSNLELDKILSQIRVQKHVLKVNRL